MSVSDLIRTSSFADVTNHAESVIGVGAQGPLQRLHKKLEDEILCSEALEDKTLQRSPQDPDKEWFKKACIAPPSVVVLKIRPPDFARSRT